MLLLMGCGGAKPMPCTTSRCVNGPDAGMRDAGSVANDAGSGIGGSGSVSIKVDTAMCPDLTMTVVAPLVFALDTPSPISGSASDDAGDEVVFKWSASAGRFDNRARAQTMFTCTELGAQTLTLLAVTRGSCSEAVARAFSCM
jgi:hypothetical protein